MQNPIKQAKLQAQTLKKVLLNAANKDTQKAIEYLNLDVLVTISDGGIFIGDRSIHPEICKADEVDDYVKKR